MSISRTLRLPRVHFTAPAGSCRDDFARFGFAGVASYLKFARASLPASFHLTGNPRLFDVVERPDAGGRDDDGLRIADVQNALDDPATRAIVAARGGSWFSRIVGRLDFSALARRRVSDPLWVFGFSEITSLVNFVASYPAGRGVYWLCPNYVGWKVKPQRMGRAAFAEFWRVLAEMIARPTESGHASGVSVPARAVSGSVDPTPSPVAAAMRSTIQGTLVSGHLPTRGNSQKSLQPGSIRLLGGCLSVLAATLPGPLARRLRPQGTWLLIEDIHEAPYRIDRQLAPLGLLGWFDRLAGVLVGDFHSADDNQQAAAVAALRRHVPRGLPIVATGSVGHVWPMTPVPLNQPLRMFIRRRNVRIETPWSR